MSHAARQRQLRLEQQLESVALDLKRLLLEMNSGSCNGANVQRVCEKASRHRDPVGYSWRPAFMCFRSIYNVYSNVYLTPTNVYLPACSIQLSM